MTSIAAAAVLFDMDGTLVDSTTVVEALWTHFADHYQLPAADLLAFSHGRQTADTIARFLPDHPDREQVTRAFHAAELTAADGITEIPGARTLLEQLTNTPHAIVTSAPRDLAIQRLTVAGLPIPPVLVTAEDTPLGKPDPAGYLRAAHQLAVAPGDCLIFEDAEAGLRAAVGTGSRVVVVGPHHSATTVGLHRVPDLRHVQTHHRPGGVSVHLNQPATRTEQT